MRQRLALLNIRSLGNRFADPEGVYRETYAATCVVGALLELWADDMPDEATVIAGCRIRRASWDPAHEVGVLPAERVDGLVVITITTPRNCFVDVAAVVTRTWLVRQPALKEPLRRAKATSRRLDSGLLEGSGPRSRIVTQAVGRIVYDAAPDYAGIAYRTRLGGPEVNWVIFGRSRVGLANRQPLKRTDPAVVDALAQLGMRLP